MAFESASRMVPSCVMDVCFAIQFNLAFKPFR
jgi:hypothetical protein